MRTFTARGRSRRGNYATIVALSLTVLMGFAALSIDSARLRAADYQVQNVADAAALGALTVYRDSGDPSAATAAANFVISQNWVAEDLGGLETIITFGTWDWDTMTWDSSGTPPNAIEVEVARSSSADSGEVDVWMNPMVGGTDAVEVRGSSIGAMRYREIIVVLDVTGSFANEIGLAKEAVLDFLDFVEAMQLPGDKIGMVTFTGGAEEWTELQYIDGNYGTIRSQWETISYCNRSAEKWEYYARHLIRSSHAMAKDTGYAAWAATYGNESPMMPCYVGSDWDPLDTVDARSYFGYPAWGTVNPYYADSGTYQGVGLAMGASILADSDDKFAEKVIVLVSDGRPECVIPKTGTQSACASARWDGGIAAADAAFDDHNVSIFTVAFNDPPDSTLAAYMASLTRGYGEAYETPDKYELPDILKEIASQIPLAVVD